MKGKAYELMGGHLNKLQMCSIYLCLFIIEITILFFMKPKSPNTDFIVLIFNNNNIYPGKIDLALKVRAHCFK